MLNFVDPTEVKLPNPENRDSLILLTYVNQDLTHFLTYKKMEKQSKLIGEKE